MATIETPRMRLLPGTAELVRLELEDRAGLGRALRADVPEDWPPETIRDAVPWFLGRLTTNPGLTGWLCWYGIVRASRAEPDTLAASGGFFGPPADGAVEIGYSVLPRFQRQGYATEMAAAMTGWALGQPGVGRVTAEADSNNTPSLRLLRRLGFVELGPGREAGHRLFERQGSGSGDAPRGNEWNHAAHVVAVFETAARRRIMPDEKNEKIATPWGAESPQDLSTGGSGAGASATDTGGLDADGNELGATSPGSRHGRTEADRMDEGSEGARKP